MPVSLDQAEALVKAAKAKAAEIGIAVAVVVLDDGGHLKAFARMDGAWLGATDVAMKKARTSVLFPMETQQIWEVSKPDAQAHGLELTNDGLVTFAGGIPLKARDGRLLGAIGVSGGQVAQDYEVAQAGFSALGA
jgi:uncharacterized protein GlcG (DUF336 family)